MNYLIYLITWFKNRARLISNHLDWTSLVNNRFTTVSYSNKNLALIRIKEELFICMLWEREPTVMVRACFSFNKLKHKCDMRGLQWWLNIKTLSDMICQKAVNFVHFVSHSIQYFSLCGIKAGNLEGPCALREPIKTHDSLSLAQGHYQPYSATVSLWLTTTSLHGGWMPETSRSLYYCQPAPIWRLLPWLANPGNPAKSPQARKGKLPGWWGTTSNNTASSRSKHTKDCFKRRAHGIPMHAHM